MVQYFNEGNLEMWDQYNSITLLIKLKSHMKQKQI